MVREDSIVMRESELRRIHVVRQVLAKQLTHQAAGEALGLTPRHIRRLRDRLQAEGEAGLAHRGRGKPSNRRIAESVKTQVLRLYDEQYGDFGPTLAAEKLAERDKITLSAETLRGWLLAKSALVAQQRLATRDGDPKFLEAKVVTARFYAEVILPPALAQLGPLKAAGRTVFALTEEQF